MSTSPRISTRTSCVRRWVIASLLVLMAGAFAYHTWLQQTHQAALLAEWQAEEQQLHRLDKVVSISFGKPVPLQGWLAEVTRQTGVEFKIENGIHNSATRNRPLSDTISPELPVWLDLREVSAREAVQTLCTLLHIDGGLRDGVYVVNVELADEPRYLKVYSLPPELRTEELDDLSEQALQFSYFGDWDWDGEPRALERGPGGFAVFQPDRGHQRLEQFLQRLALVCKQSNTLPLTGLAADDPRLAAVWLGGENEQYQRVVRALDEPITLQAEGLTLPDLIDELTAQAKFTIVATPEALSQFGAQKLEGELQHVPLRQVLRELTADSQFAFVPIAGCRALAIAPPGIASQVHHQTVLAYPVGDFLAVGETNSLSLANREADLIELLGSTIQPESWRDVGGGGDREVVNRGRVLVVSQSLENHRRIEDLLVALRRVQSSTVRQVVIDPPASPSRPLRLERRLRAPVSFQCVGHPRWHATREFLEVGGVTLALIYGEAPDAGTPVWCYLPPRPLRVNLELFFGSCEHNDYLDLVTLPGNDRVQVDPPLGYAVFDRRPWLRRRPDQPDLAELLYDAIDPDYWQNVGGPGALVNYQDMLVIQANAELLDRTSKFLDLLEKHLEPGPKRWDGQLLTGDAWNRPLPIPHRSRADLQRAERTAQENQIVEQRLRKPVTATFEGHTVGQAILALARAHELPVIIHQPRADLRRVLESFQAMDVPLGEVLQQLVGELDGEAWQVRDGYLTLVEDPTHPRSESSTRWLLYAVDDLVVPRGRLLPKQLQRTLTAAIYDNDLETEIGSTGPTVHFGNLLVIWLDNPESPGQAIFEQLLRDLRSGKLRPAAAEEGDRDYQVPPFVPVYRGLPVVGQAPVTGGSTRY